MPIDYWGNWTDKPGPDYSEVYYPQKKPDNTQTSSQQYSDAAGGGCSGCALIFVIAVIVISKVCGVGFFDAFDKLIGFLTFFVPFALFIWGGFKYLDYEEKHNTRASFRYDSDGQIIFTDGAGDSNVVLEGLRDAQAKWGGITINGSDEKFKSLCVRLAAEHGINITNPELQARIEKEKEEIKKEKERRRMQVIRGERRYKLTGE